MKPALNFRKGDKLLAVGVRDLLTLTEGRVYEAISDIKEGIFEDRPFIVVMADNNKPCTAHARRFRKVEAQDA